jgi:hypothetical protein
MEPRTRSNGVCLGALALAVVLAITIAPPAGAAKKKGKRVRAIVDITQAVGAPIPDATPVQGGGPPIDGVLLSTINVGKRFKGRRVRDVNVTVQTTGISGGNPASDLNIFLTAPNRATALAFADPGGFGSTAASVGPLTLDDESSTALGDGLQSNPFELSPPFAGTARPLERLARMDNGPARGVWTLVALDTTNPPPDRVSVLNSWRLTLTTGRPFRTK